jgi:hypothetical protein
MTVKRTGLAILIVSVLWTIQQGVRGPAIDS